MDTSSIDPITKDSGIAIVYFFDKNGDLTGKWERKRSVCRRGLKYSAGLPEFYDFSPEGDHFYISFNSENADSCTLDPRCWITNLLCINTSGDIEWETLVGELGSAGLLFSDDGQRIVWAGSGHGGLPPRDFAEITILTNTGHVLLRHEKTGGIAGKPRCRLNGDELSIRWRFSEERVDIRSGQLIKNSEKSRSDSNLVD